MFQLYRPQRGWLELEVCLGTPAGTNTFIAVAVSVLGVIWRHFQAYSNVPQMGRTITTHILRWGVASVLPIWGY